MGTPWTQDPMDAPPCVILSPVDVQANALARHLAVPPGALRAASLRKQSFLRRIRTGARAYALARHLAVPPGALRAASLRKQSFLRRIRTGARAYALAPWGMQPNTSHDESSVLYHLSSDSAYYTIFRNSAVTGLEEILARAAFVPDILASARFFSCST